MKFIYLLLAVVAVVNAAHVGEEISQQSISTIVVDMIEGIKEQMPCGFPGMGIPPVAPLRINQKNINIDTSALKMQGSIDHFRLNGLDDFDIEQMKVNPITSKVTYKFIFKNINVDTVYDLSMKLKNFGFTIDLVGKGHAKFALKDMIIWGTMKYSLGVISGKLKLKTMEVRTRISDIESDIKGILGEGATNHKMNNYLEEAVQLVVNENEDLIADTIEAMALPMVNSALADITMAEIIAGSGGGEGEKEVCIPPELDW